MSKLYMAHILDLSGAFFELLEIASPTAEYLALCDQDDIWQEDKLSRAVTFLSRYPSEMPALYCSRLAIVDENLKPLKYSDVPRRRLSFRNALVENQGAGVHDPVESGNSPTTDAHSVSLCQS